jgi:hypothetical protein
MDNPHSTVRSQEYSAPVNLCLFVCPFSATCSTLGSSPCGAEGIRTPDLRRAKAALSQLSYSPGIDDDPLLVSGPFRART